MTGSVTAIKSEKRMLLIKYLDEHSPNYETLFTCNQDSIFTMDIEGNVVQTNPSFEELSGYSSNEAEQLKLQLLFPIDNINKVFHHFHKAVLGQFENFDCKMINKMGSVIDLNITNIPISVNDQIVGVCAVARDISALKRKKEEIRKIEEMQRILREDMLELLLSTNLRGEILYVSPSCEHIFGYPSSEVLKQSFLSFVHPDDMEQAYLNRKKVLNTFENGRDCYRIRKKNGDYVWVESLCKPITAPDTHHVLEVVSIIRDITERKRAEEEARKREITYRDLVEHSPDAVIIARENEILFVNETGARLLGAEKKEEVLQKGIYDFIHPECHAEAEYREIIVENGSVTEFYEYRLIRLDGTILVAEVKGLPTIYRNKPARHIILRDITERKKTQELLLNSEKLNVAGQLAAGIAHEVRNPLTAIKGFLQLMESEFDGNNTYFEIIQSEMNRIELILNELLLLAKPHELKFEQVDLLTLIENVKTLLNTQAIMNGIQMETIYNGGRLTIHGDRNQLKQVFINILKNAIEAMPGGGFVTIEVKPQQFNEVKILFKDTGNGMPNEILKRIGEPFFTTKVDGTGLGLMLSKQIVENHEGTIRFWSNQKGTVLEVVLPLEYHDK